MAGPAVAFALVDVFATGPLTGAPLALVPDADQLSEDTMRAIAREFNQSETTFVLTATATAPGATWRLRSFTPTGQEVGGAGHNALGAWLWLASAGRLPGTTGRLTQQIGERVLPVEVTGAGTATVTVWMGQAPPRLGAAAADTGALAAALGLRVADLDGDRARVVDTGAAHLMVAATGRDAVDRAVPDAAALTALLRGAGGEGCYLYTGETVSADAAAYARFFNPAMGIGEDPATGTAAGPLAALLTARGRLADGETAVIEQGHRLGRPARIEVAVDGGRVSIGGGGVVVAEGRLALPAGERRASAA